MKANMSTSVQFGSAQIERQLSVWPSIREQDCICMLLFPKDEGDETAGDVYIKMTVAQAEFMMNRLQEALDRHAFEAAERALDGVVAS